MPNYVKLTQALVNELQAEEEDDQKIARQILAVVTANLPDTANAAADSGSERKPKRQRSRSGVGPAKQRSVKEALLELGDGATDEQIVEDIRVRQNSNELSKDDATALVQVRSRASGMRYVRPHRGGGWELVGAIRSQIRKPHAVTVASA